MLTKDDIEALNSEILSLIRSQREDDAIAVVKSHWLIFRYLPDNLRDNRKFAIAAMSRSLQAGTDASSRLKGDIDLFMEAFNLYKFRNPASFTSIRDIAFILQYAKYDCHFRHEISEATIAAKFEASVGESKEDIRLGLSLAEFCRGPTFWITGNKEKDLIFIERKFPEFSQYAYHYAFTWAFGREVVRAAAEFR